MSFVVLLLVVENSTVPLDGIYGNKEGFHRRAVTVGI